MKSFSKNMMKWLKSYKILQRKGVAGKNIANEQLRKQLGTKQREEK